MVARRRLSSRELWEKIVRCIENTTLDAKKISGWYGVSPKKIQKVIDEVRPWQKQH